MRIINWVFAAMGLVFLAQPANAASLTVQWFTLSTSDADVGGGQCCNVFPNMVESTLGPNGLPVLSSSYSGPTISDVNSNRELTWWSPSLNSNVVSTGSSSLTLPIGQNMFPPNGTGSDDNSSYQTAILTGTLVVPVDETVSFTLGSDDDTFLAIGNNVVAQVGGVHASGNANYSTLLTAGNYSLTLFYADRDHVAAYLDFSIDTLGVGLQDSSTPLPAALPLFATGLGAFGLLGWRRKRKQVA
jgi:fibro-slime domain-containing protein